MKGGSQAIILFDIFQNNRLKIYAKIYLPSHMHFFCFQGKFQISILTEKFTFSLLGEIEHKLLRYKYMLMIKNLLTFYMKKAFKQQHFYQVWNTGMKIIQICHQFINFFQNDRHSCTFGDECFPFGNQNNKFTTLYLCIYM